MSKLKWGESFLKSGLPLEHLTLLTINSLGWHAEPHFEYSRPNREGAPSWFEVDFVVSPPEKRTAALKFMVECKYHDAQRFWVFLPCELDLHTSERGAQLAGTDMRADAQLLFFAPVCPLARPQASSFLPLAPASVWGTVVSHDGTKQENSLRTALDQLAYAFVPQCRDNFPSDRPVGVLPIVVTTAQLYRLRPAVSSLEAIRSASAPIDVADPLPWTWCYYAPSGPLLTHNSECLDEMMGQKEFEEQPHVREQLYRLWASPSWIAVINFDSLQPTLRLLHDHFLKLRLRDRLAESQAFQVSYFASTRQRNRRPSPAG